MRLYFRGSHSKFSGRGKIPKFLKSTKDTSKANPGVNTGSTLNEHEPRNTNTTFDLSWIDGFIAKIRDYIYVRDIDRLLIIVPNQAYRLNESGFLVIDHLLKGRRLDEFLARVGGDEAKRRDIHYFFCDLRALVSGCLREHDKREAVSYYEFGGLLTEYPVLSEIAVTYQCNLNCDFCYVGAREYGQLGTGDVKKILFKIYHEAKIPSVSFTGGEPLTRQDICILIGYASEIGLWTNLITNATLLDPALAKRLKNIGLSSAQVSIEGPSPEIHDSITGVSGSFRATLQGIELLIKNGISVHTNTTVSRHNIDHLKDILGLVRHIGLERLSMNLLIPCGTAADKKHLWVAYSEIGPHILDLKERAEAQGIRFLWYSPTPLCKFNPIAHGIGNKSCAAVTGLLSIDPLGNVIPCSSWRAPVGSLLKNSFKDLWQSPMLQYFKNSEYAPDQCRRCIDFAACKGACPLYWRSCGLGEIDG